MPVVTRYITVQHYFIRYQMHLHIVYIDIGKTVYTNKYVD